MSIDSDLQVLSTRLAPDASDADRCHGIRPPFWTIPSVGSIPPSANRHHEHGACFEREEYNASVYPREEILMSTVEPKRRIARGSRRYPSREVVRFPRSQQLTDCLFADLCLANPNLHLERTACGELVVMSPAGSGSSRRNQLLSQRLGVWADSNGLGVALDSSCGYTLPNGAIRSPDASWITQERWDALTPAGQESFAHICPDFVAELRSPSDVLDEVQLKMCEYIAQGARLGWLIDPRRNVVEIYRPGRPVEIMKATATVSGEDVLPGFTLELNGILPGRGK